MFQYAGVTFKITHIKIKWVAVFAYQTGINSTEFEKEFPLIRVRLAPILVSNIVLSQILGIGKYCLCTVYNTMINTLTNYILYTVLCNHIFD